MPEYIRIHWSRNRKSVVTQALRKKRKKLANVNASHLLQSWGKWEKKCQRHLKDLASGIMAEDKNILYLVVNPVINENESLEEIGTGNRK